ncbi:MAG: response regulator [Magnetococcales bacterium]|nr:response regulator [Magnetococcales bacterium]NGZ07187.1 response regulator [Magnetococcales bacterium]
MDTVVIVDDEVHIRSLLEQTLEELQEDYAFEIVTAANGGDGLAVVQRERPRLVFLDVMMPVMNGYDVCKAIRADASLNETRVVMLTAKGQEADRQRGLDVGVNHFMTKPFDPDEILKLAETILKS